jgi:hypothetical protein
MLEKIKDTVHLVSAKIYTGDIGVNQAAEVGGLVGVATAVTAGVAGFGDDIGEAIGTWLGDLF